MLLRCLLTVVVLAFGFAVREMLRMEQVRLATAPVDFAAPSHPSVLAGVGVIEPETENVAIGTDLPGIVVKVFAKTGESIRSGDPLFRLDEGHLQPELAVRKARLAAADVELARFRAMPRAEEVAPLAAKVAEAKAVLPDHEQQFDRHLTLERLNAISRDEFTRRRSIVAISRAQLTKAEADLRLVEAGAWNADVAICRAARDMAEAQVHQTEAAIERLTIRAPIAGANDKPFRVLQVNVHAGEYVGGVQGQPLLVLGQVDRMHVRVSIDEADLARFHHEMPAVARPRSGQREEIPITFVRVEPFMVAKRSLTGASIERTDTRVLNVIYRINQHDRPLFVGQLLDIFFFHTAETHSQAP